MDTGRRSELLAADLSVGEIADYLKVDSLAYLELDRLTRATGAPAAAFCTACLSGRYPVPVPVVVGDSKRVLEPPGWGSDEEPSLPVGTPPSA
jgi:amidophosphoribosyltransferase